MPKVWTNHERKSAQSRALKQKQEYILPARFDETQIPGMDGISYIDLIEYSPYEFADLVINKLKTFTENNLSERLSNYIPKSQKFNYTIDYDQLSILDSLDKSRYRYRATNKIIQELGEDRELVLAKLNELKNKGLIDLVERPTGKKWAITKDGKEYLDYYYHERDEGS